MHIADVHQQIREEDSVHHLIDVVRVRPDQHDGIFGAIWHGVKAMRYPWLDLMRPVLSGIDRRGYRPSLDGGYLALEDLESLRLIEMEVERRCLNFLLVIVTWKPDGISVQGIFLPEDDLCLVCREGGRVCKLLLSELWIEVSKEF